MDSKLRCVFELPDDKKAQSVSATQLSGKQHHLLFKYQAVYLTQLVFSYFSAEKLKQNVTSGSENLHDSGNDDKVS